MSETGLEAKNRNLNNLAGAGGKGAGGNEMTPTRVPKSAKRNMGLIPPRILSGSSGVGFESPSDFSFIVLSPLLESFLPPARASKAYFCGYSRFLGVIS